jgi:TPP-dependent pyruvate/acetoin dehydrogenase alpha subunit
MLIERLRDLLAQMERLPEAAQNEVADRLRELVEELQEREWDESLADPRSDAFFDEMYEEYQKAKQQDALDPLPRRSPHS